MFVPVSLEDYGFGGGGISFNINILYILSIFVLLLIHELIHLSLIPNFTTSKHTGIGIHIFGGFVFSEEVMSRLRFLIVSLAPFVIISIILPLLLGALGYLNPLLIFLIILNALGSSVDLLNVVLVLSQVPKKAQIRNHGMSTFWK
nr:metalloprotease family protein [Paenibacillus periandrae]